MPKHNQITLMDDLPLGKAELGISRKVVRKVNPFGGD